MRCNTSLDWISAARFHPVNILLGTVLVDVGLLLAGISPNVMLWVGPFTTASSAFVHANLNWTLGPFKYVMAGPVFHRWHHTLPDRGGNKNFAGTFPIWDLMFGTWYMPENELPEKYGVDDEAFGQRLAAYVVTSDGSDLDADTVRAHVKSQLAGYKVPRDVVFLDELPRNASGKVVARDLPGVAS